MLVKALHLAQNFLNESVQLLYNQRYKYWYTEISIILHHIPSVYSLCNPNPLNCLYWTFEDQEPTRCFSRRSGCRCSLEPTHPPVRCVGWTLFFCFHSGLSASWPAIPTPWCQCPCMILWGPRPSTTSSTKVVWRSSWRPPLGTRKTWQKPLLLLLCSIIANHRVWRRWQGGAGAAVRQGQGAPGQNHRTHADSQQRPGQQGAAGWNSPPQPSGDGGQQELLD